MLAQNLPDLALSGRSYLLLAGAALTLAAVLLAVGRLLARGKRRAPLPIEAPREPDPFTTKNLPEKRRTPRRRGNAVEVLISDASLTALPVRGWVQDRSMGGMCLVLNRAITVSTLLHVRATAAAVRTPWVQVTVRNCRAWESYWLLGCQFIQTPPWAVLLTFG
jgi:hypothetical protein